LKALKAIIKTTGKNVINQQMTNLPFQELFPQIPTRQSYLPAMHNIALLI